jgi:hypothetical protein
LVLRTDGFCYAIDSTSNPSADWAPLVTILDPKVATLYWRIEGKTTEFYLPWYSKDKIGGDLLLNLLLLKVLYSRSNIGFSLFR